MMRNAARHAAVLVFALALLQPSGTRAQVDLNFNEVRLLDIVQTVATLGKFNALVAPDLDTKLSYSRKGVPPLEALKEIAKLAGAELTEASPVNVPLYLLTRGPLPSGLAGPEAADGLPTDFSFKEVDLRNIAATMGVLGKFDVSVPADLQHLKLTASFKQITPAQALFWTASVAGLTAERGEGAGGRPLYTIRKR